MKYGYSDMSLLITKYTRKGSTNRKHPKMKLLDTPFDKSARIVSIDSFGPTAQANTKN